MRAFVLLLCVACCGAKEAPKIAEVHVEYDEIKDETTYQTDLVAVKPEKSVAGQKQLNYRLICVKGSGEQKKPAKFFQLGLGSVADHDVFGEQRDNLGNIDGNLFIDGKRRDIYFDGYVAGDRGGDRAEAIVSHLPIDFLTAMSKGKRVGVEVGGTRFYLTAEDLALWREFAAKARQPAPSRKR